MSFLQIPGNIKQQFIPFVLKPDAAIHKAVQSSPELKSASPQYFTYKNVRADMCSGGCGKLNFYPSSLKSWQINDDISYKLLYNNHLSYANNKTKSITIDDILNTIPGVQIREFIPDTRLDQCINFFTEVFSAISTVFKSGGSSSSGSFDINRLFDQITTTSQYVIQYLTGTTTPNFYTNLGISSKELPFSLYGQDIFELGNNNKSPGFYVMTFPYILYYRLQSCTTTNIYEIPSIPSNKQILESNGSAGWTSGGDSWSNGGFRVTNIFNAIPGVGQLANMLLGNIGINYMPWWDAKSGTSTKAPNVEITFDLFNDSAEAALINFIFINTIVPNNTWIQYNMFQHSSSLYDIKIDGINRLYACAGDFSVSYEGVLRDPPSDWFEYNGLLSKYINKNMNMFFESSIQSNKLIKIPDIYRVKLVFQSLLPANFNNYIFNYAENANHINKYDVAAGQGAYEPSILEEKLPNAINNLITDIKTTWDEAGKDYDSYQALFGD